ncbi:MAG: HU family DNA-binding protein [Rhodospirillaceae bacterium]
MSGILFLDARFVGVHRSYRILIIGDDAQMNRSELAEALAAESTLTRKDAEALVTSTFKIISSAMARGEDVNVAGFGIFTVAESAERDGRNPQTGAAIRIAASKSPKFRAAKALKDLLNTK